MKQIVAFSGGKDSTALALLMYEHNEEFDLLFTPTGNEFPELIGHINAVVAKVGKQLIVPPNRSLEQWITHFGALPNSRQRWCTRLIKVEPCIAYLKQHPGSILCIGLRADEEGREGLYGSYATYRYPLREAGMNFDAVLALCDRYGLRPKMRTDCAVCPYQRLAEWYWLWRDNPLTWTQGEVWEACTGHTFRSASRDTWPAAMKDMRIKFETGDVPERSLKNMARDQACRVCSL
jgi:hypothetical protein